MLQFHGTAELAASEQKHATKEGRAADVLSHTEIIPWKFTFNIVNI